MVEKEPRLAGEPGCVKGILHEQEYVHVNGLSVTKEPKTTSSRRLSDSPSNTKRSPAERRA